MQRHDEYDDWWERVLVWLALLFVHACATTPSNQPETPGVAATALSSGVDFGSTDAPSEAAGSGGASHPSSPGVSAVTPAQRAELVTHDYHVVYRGAARVLLRERGPYLVAGEGAIDLITRTVGFQRYDANWKVAQGNTLWFMDGFSPMSACPEASTLVELVGERWVSRREINVHDLLIQPWKKGSSIAAIVPYRLGPPWGYELVVLEGNRTPPRAARRRPDQLPECATRIADLLALQAFPSGEIFVFGNECERSMNMKTREVADVEELPAPAVVVESWREGRHEFSVLPLTELEFVEGVSATDIWASGSLDGGRVMAHFDGSNWQVLPDVYEQPIQMLAVFPGQTGAQARRLVAYGNQLFELQAGSSKQHALPPACTLTALELEGEELWLSCDDEGSSTLYTTRSDIAEVHFDPAAVEREPRVFTGRAYAKLDPRGPSIHSCKEHSTPPQSLFE